MLRVCCQTDTSYSNFVSDISSVFQRFTQSNQGPDSPTTRGAGLGLAISKQLVELMGGEIACRSEVGSGSCFEFTAALCRAEPAPHGGEAAAVVGLQPLPLCVAIAAEHAQTRALLRRTVESVAAQTAEFTSMQALSAAMQSLKAQSLRDGHAVVVVASLRGSCPQDGCVEVLERLCTEHCTSSGVDARPGQSASPGVHCIVLAPIRVAKDARARGNAWDVVLVTPVRQRHLIACLQAVAAGRRVPHSAVRRSGSCAQLAEAALAQAAAREAAYHAVSPRSLAAPAEDTGSPSAMPSRPRVLVVDDDTTSQKLIRRILEMAGYSVDTAYDGVQAMDYMCCHGDHFCEGRYCAALVDLVMPRCDGATLATRVREIEATEALVHLPIVGITGGSMTDINRCRKAGMDRFVPKPMKRAQLLDAVGRASSNYEGQGQVVQGSAPRPVGSSRAHPPFHGATTPPASATPPFLVRHTQPSPTSAAGAPDPGAPPLSAVILDFKDPARREAVERALVDSGCVVKWGYKDSIYSGQVGWFGDSCQHCPPLDLIVTDAADPACIAVAQRLCAAVRPGRIVSAGMGALERDARPPFGVGGVGSAAAAEEQEQSPSTQDGDASLEYPSAEPAIFTHALPASPAPSDLIALLGAAAGLRRARLLPTALVVEDDRVSRMVIVGLLTSLSWKSVVAANGAEALRCAAENPGISCVLMDVNMPVLNGFNATRCIRQAEGATVFPLPVIAVTANALVGDAARCYDAGMDAYLSKPVKRSELSDTLQAFRQEGHGCHTPRSSIAKLAPLLMCAERGPGLCGSQW